MTLVVSNSSEQTMLELLLNISSPEDLVLRLYSNNVTPSEADVAGTYTEVTGGGYASVTLVPANWGITPGDPTQALHPEIIFTFTGSIGNVYGYFLTQVTSGDLMWAERFTNGPFNITTNGDQIKVTLSITLE